MARSKGVLAILAIIASVSGASGVIVTKTPTVASTSKTPTPATTAPVSLSASTSFSFHASGSSSSASDSSGSSALVASGSSSLEAAWSSSSGVEYLTASGSVSTEFAIATPLTAKSTVESTYRNWVGPRTLPRDGACYREAHIMDVCPTNFDRNELTNTCWAECPMDYPVECGMECIRQNDDCTSQIVNKIGVVVNVGLNGIMYNVFGKFSKMAKTVRTAVMCSCMMFGMTRALIRYVRRIRTTNPEATQDQILAILYQTNNVVVDLPITIKLCLGKSVGANMWLADRILATSQFVLLQVLTHDDQLILSWNKFKAFLKGANVTEPAAEITEGEIGSFKEALESNSTCGLDIKSLTDRTWAMIEELRKENPDISDDDIRLQIQNTSLVMTDIATVTNNCMPQLIKESDEATAYQTRDKLRKTMATIVNDLIKSGKSDNGSHAVAKELAYKTIDTGLIAFAVLGFEMTGIPGMLAEYIQTICGPTQYIGEVDDGTHPDTLGLTTKQKAFNGSSMSWTRKGDGKVIINFTSKDTEDVTVNIMSGGDKVDEVDIEAGGKVTWTSNVTFLGGRTLYLDRWRPGFLGLPGMGGGSLLLWVPHAAEGGHLELNARLNVS